MTDRYTTPGGVSSGQGTINTPWGLDWAFNGAGGVLQPGDTVWMRGGFYNAVNGFAINTVGVIGPGVDSPTGKIIYRNFPRELVTIAATADNQDSLQMNGNYNWLIGTMGQGEGIEVYRPVLTRTQPRGTCIWFGATPQTGNKTANVVVHDGANGILNGGFTSDYDYGEMEIHGCISFNNGTEDTSSRVHGMYIRHQGVSTKLRCTANVVFNQLGLGIQVYVGTGASHNDGMRNVEVEDNIVWGAGSLGTLIGAIFHNILFGGLGGNNASPARGCKCNRNILFQPTQSDASGQLHVGGNNVINEDMECQDNYMVSNALDQIFGSVRIMPFKADGSPSLKYNRNEHITLSDCCQIEIFQAGSVANFTQWTNNKYYNPVADDVPDSNTNPRWRHNLVDETFPAWKADTGIGSSDTADVPIPTVNKVVIKMANKYNADGKYAYVCYFNWERGSSVQVDLSSVLAINDQYEIYDIQSWRTGQGFGAPLFSGIYGGGTFAFPTAPVTPPPPIGATPRLATATGPFFNAYFVKRIIPGAPPVTTIITPTFTGKTSITPVFSPKV